MSEGSLQVMAISPFRAAIFPLIFTVGLPSLIVARFAGDFWNGPPWGMWGGVFVAVESTVAAGIPMIFTSELRLPSMMPAKG
jgi:hypothetical protein